MLSPTFIERLEEIVLVLRPFVHWCVVTGHRLGSGQTDIDPPPPCSLNDMMTIQDPDPESSDEDDDE